MAAVSTSGREPRRIQMDCRDPASADEAERSFGDPEKCVGLLHLCSLAALYSAFGRCNRQQEENCETRSDPGQLGQFEQLANPGRCSHICLRSCRPWLRAIRALMTHDAPS